MGQTTNPQYLETFNKKVSVIESYVGAIGTDPVLFKEEISGSAKPEDVENQASAKDAKIKYL